MQVVWDLPWADSGSPILFHPLCGAEYELVTQRLTWGEDRVFYYDLDGKLKSLMANVGRSAHS